EACNPFYARCPGAVQKEMDRFADRTGRQYRLFDYVGHPQAERVIVIMGSGAEAVQETVEGLVAGEGEGGRVKVGVCRAFATRAFIKALPRTVKRIAVLDRTKEPGAIGEPLYQDVLTAFLEQGQESAEISMPRMIGGRYGLSSKEFDPAMVRAVFSE